jgi:hypothetical protein
VRCPYLPDSEELHANRFEHWIAGPVNDHEDLATLLFLNAAEHVSEQFSRLVNDWYDYRY